MTRMLDILEDYIISQGYQYCRIDGNTTYEEREDRIYEYNKENSEKFIFILSTRAGGLGINLQTADTVIIYDSDWNPQADLQAQDRAHRIGQKNPVQVFRLVTDDTVEVKVVERAQQKLKLDAMVVQQGRLQDKEKKLTKQDLLDTVRFGADKVFRSKESTITDEDIDMILEKGRKRTVEMNEKLQLAEKGDIYDFKLDGGMSTQVFEGKDYSDKNMRVAELNAMAGIFIDPGKRERKAINSYADSVARQTVQDEGDKRQKLPRHLRLNKMEDWQFFDKARLNELQAEEIRLFDQLIEKGEAPQSGNIGKFVVLSPELQEEKTRLIAEAFGDWTRVHFNNFTKASAKHGRHEYEKIAKDVSRPVEDIKQYALAFWGKGATELPPAEWERVTKQIEKGEKRIEEINRLTSATAKLIMMFEDPWEELTFRNLGNQNRIFNAVEDRFLLCLTHLHGYGNWDLVKNSIRRCERFRFDFYLQSCSAEALGKRCEALMKSAERELSEIEKKRLAADQHSIAASAGNPAAAHAFPNAASRGLVSLTTSGNAVEVAKEKLAEVTRQITEEAKKLANARAQLTKTKNVVIPVASAAGGSAANMKAFLDSASSAAGPSAPTAAAAGAEKEKSARGGSVASSTVPEGLLPELCKYALLHYIIIIIISVLCVLACLFACTNSINPSLRSRLLKAAGADGIGKIINAFYANHPHIPKRQVELKIADIAIKEKRPGGADKIIWYVLPEYEKYLHMENFESSSSEPPEKPAKPAAKNKKEKAATTTTTTNPVVVAEEEPSSGSKPKAAKRPRESDTPSVATSSEPSMPKKFKRAFGFFVKAKKAEAEKALGPGHVNKLNDIHI